mgnify:CR=1 FL=1
MMIMGAARCQNGNQGAHHAVHPVPEDHGGVDGNGTGRGLGDGGDVQHLLLFQPLQVFHNFFFIRRRLQAAAEGEGTEQEGGLKQLPQHPCRVFFRSHNRLLPLSYFSLSEVALS